MDKDIRYYVDLVTLGLASVCCVDELLDVLREAKKNNSYDVNKKRTGLGCLKDSFDYLTGKKIPDKWGNMVFVSYQEGFVLRKFFKDRREDYDAGLRNLSLCLEGVLDEETSKDKRVENSEKMIKFFSEIGSMCNRYVERPLLELLPGYVPIGLVKLMRK